MHPHALLRSRYAALLGAAALALTLGCNLHKATSAFTDGNYEESAKAYKEILDRDPSNVQARIGYKRATMRASEEHLAKAREAERQKKDDLVYKEVLEAYRLDPSNALAQDWIARLEEKRLKEQAELEAAHNIDNKRIKGESKPTAILNPRSMEQMELNFVRKTSLREILAAISRNSGVSILFHSSFVDTSVSADLRGLSFQRVLDTLMIQSDMFYKVIDTNTIMVFKNTPQNREQFENQFIKTFYLSNANVDDVRSIFQTLMPQLRVFVDKRLNAVTIKAKPTDLAIAKRIVSQLDKAKAEVMIYIELLEVSENSLAKVGLLPVQKFGDASGIYRLFGSYNNKQDLNKVRDQIHITKADIRYLYPNLALDALKQNGDAWLVASPNVRVISGETGEVNIGEKVSTTQTQLSTTGTTDSKSTSGDTTQTTFSYEDVGVKIKVEPRVHFNDDITLKIESSVTSVVSGGDTGRPNIGRREIKTFSRLRDGETVVFGGLLKDEEQKSLNGIWGIQSIPGLGKLLGNNYKRKAKTDVILTMRAVLVRRPDLTEEDFEAFDPDLASSRSGPFAATVPTDAQPMAAPTSPTPGKVPAPTTPPSTPNPVPPATPAVPPPTPSNPATPPTPPKPAPATPEPDGSELVVFLTPLATTVSAGDQVQLTLMISGGKTINSGSVDLRIDPKLKFTAVDQGDFLDDGTLNHTLSADGTLKLNFKRNATNDEVEDGILAIIDLTAATPGHAPVVIQGGRYMTSTSPLAARTVNALVTVE